MTDITYPQVIAFSNQVVRPLAELLRRLDILNEDSKDTYAAQIMNLIAANLDGDLIEDGRADEGISRLTKKDLVDFMEVVQTVSTFFGNASTRDIVRKPTVRPLIQLA
jgi:hypothetical protein